MQHAIKWAGTKESFHVFENAVKSIATASPEMLDRKKAWDDDWDDDDDDYEPRHPLLAMDGQVGIVTVDGVLVPGVAGWWGQLFSMVGYDDIRNAVVTALELGAKEILITMKTPGGAVVGVGALTDFLKEAAGDVPITFYSDTFVASAGVWTAVSTGKFLCGPHTEVGSIGVVMVNTEVSKMYAEMGINQTVFRTSELKAIGAAEGEALTDAQKAELKRSVDESGDRFIQHVAASMKLEENYVRTELATGQMWYADEAKQKGLISGIITFDKLLVAIQNRLSQNNANAGRQTQNSFQAEADMTKKVLKQKISPEETMALAASGIVKLADVNQDDDPDEEVNDVDQGLPLKQKPVKDPGVKEEMEPDDKEDDEDEDDQKAKNKDETLAVSSVMKMVQETNKQLLATTVELTKVQGEAALAKAEVETMAANEKALKSVVVLAIQHGMVSLGQTPTDTDALMALGASVLVGQHASIHAQLATKFGKGGRVTVSVDETSEEDSAKGQSQAEYVQGILQKCSTIGTK